MNFMCAETLDLKNSNVFSTVVPIGGTGNKKNQYFKYSYRNTLESLGEREMLWKHEPQVSVSTA